MKGFIEVHDTVTGSPLLVSVKGIVTIEPSDNEPSTIIRTVLDSDSYSTVEESYTTVKNLIGKVLK